MLIVFAIIAIVFIAFLVTVFFGDNILHLIYRIKNALDKEIIIEEKKEIEN